MHLAVEDREFVHVPGALGVFRRRGRCRRIVGTGGEGATECGFVANLRLLDAHEAEALLGNETAPGEGAVDRGHAEERRAAEAGCGHGEVAQGDGLLDLGQFVGARTERHLGQARVAAENEGRNAGAEIADVDQRAADLQDANSVWLGWLLRRRRGAFLRLESALHGRVPTQIRAIEFHPVDPAIREELTPAKARPQDRRAKEWFRLAARRTHFQAANCHELHLLRVRRRVGAERHLAQFRFHAKSERGDAGAEVFQPHATTRELKLADAPDACGRTGGRSSCDAGARRLGTPPSSVRFTAAS